MSTGNGLVWIGLLLMGAVVLTPNLSREQTAPAADSDAARKPGKRTTGAAPASLSAGRQELVRDPDGHFYANASVNGAQIRFMVDTGASMVALSREDAQRAGIQLGDERGIAQGVGGEIEIVPVTIDRIAIGGVEARDVRGAVAKELPMSLLGQSFLSQVGTVEIRGDRMILR